MINLFINSTDIVFGTPNWRPNDEASTWTPQSGPVRRSLTYPYYECQEKPIAADQKPKQTKF